MIVAFTGAGISKDSGIPTFAEQGDLRTKLARSFKQAHPKEFDELMSTLVKTCAEAEPNAAHKALAEWNIPIITMNIDGLHTKAGSKNVLEVHGSINNPDSIVLYGDEAPNYDPAFRMVARLTSNDTLLVIGTSFYTNFSEELVKWAEKLGISVVIINDNAAIKVPELLINLDDTIEDYDIFMERELNIAPLLRPYSL